ncbi:MAG: T9SS type A sorting domain-containing protein [Bacteroidota bacterium]
MKKSNLIFIIVMCFINLLFVNGQNLDNKFGNNGKLTTEISTAGDNTILSLAIRTDNKIVAVGRSQNSIGYCDFSLACYNIDGTLDVNFGKKGQLITPVSKGRNSAKAVAIQPDNKIVVAGYADNSVLKCSSIDCQRDFAVIRYTTDGALDYSFGKNGVTITDFGSGYDGASSLAIQSDGKIVVAGNAYDGSSKHIALVRYSDGNLDNSFGQSGKILTHLEGSSSAQSIFIFSDGKILIGGNIYNGKDYDFVFVRYNSDGSIDKSFGIDGLAIIDASHDNDYMLSTILQPDGKIIGIGYSGGYYVSDFTLVRYNSDGSLDENFGTSGITSTSIDAADKAYSAALMRDGKIVVVGYTDNGKDRDFSVAMYDKDGKLENGFGKEGKVVTDFRTRSDEAHSVAILPDDKIIVAGYSDSEDGSGSDFALAKYITKLNTGIIDFAVSRNSALIYPNPIVQDATLEYTLNNEETISISLFDIQGKTIQTIIDNEKQEAGKYQHPISLSTELPSGVYIILISSSNGRMAVKIVKQ